jgi:hypothetical protein
MIGANALPAQGKELPLSRQSCPMASAASRLFLVDKQEVLQHALRLNKTKGGAAQSCSALSA